PSAPRRRRGGRCPRPAGCPPPPAPPCPPWPSAPPGTGHPSLALLPLACRTQLLPLPPLRLLLRLHVHLNRHDCLAPDRPVVPLRLADETILHPRRQLHVQRPRICPFRPAHGADPPLEPALV